MANTEIVGVRYSELPKTLSPTQDDLIAALDNESNILKATPLSSAVDCTLGDHDISEIADGTVKGAIVELNERRVVGAIELTYDEYLANKRYYDSMDNFIVIMDDTVIVMNGEQVDYDNTKSKLQAGTVQEAIDEVKAIGDGIRSDLGDKTTASNVSGNDAFDKIRTIGNMIGTTSISHIGDGTIKDAVATLDSTIKSLDVLDPAASGTTITAISTITQTDGKISATKQTIRSGTSSQSGVVTLSDSYTSSAGAASDSKAASSKAVCDAYSSLSSTASTKISKSSLTFTLSGNDLYITKTY